MFKFFALTVILDLVYSALLTTVLVPFVGPVNENFLVYSFAGIISVWPAIVTATYICFKKKNLDAKTVFKNSSWLAVVYLVVDILFFILTPKPEVIYTAVWIVIGIIGFINIPIAFFVSKYYLKKYSI